MAERPREGGGHHADADGGAQEAGGEGAPEAPGGALPERYADAVAELEALLDALDAGRTDVDELAAAVRRAVELIAFCRERLSATELVVREVLTNLPEDVAGDEDA